MLLVIPVTTTGSAGSAAGTADSATPVRGTIQGIALDYDGAAPATTDVTITEVGGLGRTILTLTNVNADGIYFPQQQISDNAGVAKTFYAPFYIDWQKIRVTVAQADALAPAVTVSIVLFEVQPLG
jgi:hypothetical protein